MSTQTSSNTDILWQAAKAGDAARIRMLVAEGVDVNVRDKNGWTPLHVATQYGHTEAMRALINARSMQNMHRYGLIKQSDKPVTWNEALKSQKSASKNTPDTVSSQNVA